MQRVIYFEFHKISEMTLIDKLQINKLYNFSNEEPDVLEIYKALVNPSNPGFNYYTVRVDSQIYLAIPYPVCLCKNELNYVTAYMN